MAHRYPMSVASAPGAGRGELDHDEAYLDEQQDLEDAKRDEQDIAHGPVQGGHQQRIRGEREAGDDDRRGDYPVHA